MEKTILIFDADVPVRESLKHLLEQGGHTVRVAANREEAIDILIAGGTDLLLLDLDQPEEAGWEVFEAATDCVPAPRIILFSCFAAQCESLADMGADALLPKPLDAAELISTVECLLNGAQHTDGIGASRLLRKSTANRFAGGGIGVGGISSARMLDTSSAYMAIPGTVGARSALGAGPVRP